MLVKAATPELIEEWKNIYEQYHPFLIPNRKSGEELITYLESRYQVKPIQNDEAKQIVIDNIMSNLAFKEKLPEGSVPIPKTYTIGDAIFVGIDIITGYFHVEGSEEIYDDLYAYRGLDEKDLENYFMVAEYVACAKL